MVHRCWSVKELITIIVVEDHVYVIRGSIHIESACITSVERISVFSVDVYVSFV